MSEFAKIIVTKNGNQVLFYVEPDGDDYNVNQIIYAEFGLMNLKFGFNSVDVYTNKKNAYAYFNSIGQKQAEKVEAQANAFMDFKD